MLWSIREGFMPEGREGFMPKGLEVSHVFNDCEESFNRERIKQHLDSLTAYIARVRMYMSEMGDMKEENKTGLRNSIFNIRQMAAFIPLKTKAPVSMYVNTSGLLDIEVEKELEMLLQFVERMRMQFHGSGNILVPPPNTDRACEILERSRKLKTGGKR